MSGIPPLQSFLLPGERVILTLNGVQVAGRSRPQRLSEGAELTYDGSPKRSLEFVRTSSGVAPTAPLAITDRRIFVPSPQFQQVAMGRPIPLREWIFDVEFARQIIRERRWIAPNGVPPGQAAGYATPVLVGRVKESRWTPAGWSGQGAGKIQLFLDAISLRASGTRVGPAWVGIPFTSSVIGVAIRALEIPVLSKDLRAAVDGGAGILKARMQSILGRGVTVRDYAVALINAGGITAETFLAYVQPYKGRMSSHIPELERQAAEPVGPQQGSWTTPVAQAAPHVARPAFCAKCGAPVTDALAVFCAGCGGRLTD